LRATWEPTTKNVARARCRLSTSRIRGVHRGSGPSSKVSAIVRSGIRWLRGVVPVASMTGPPSRTAAGTPRSPPAACVPSGAKRASAYASTISRLTRKTRPTSPASSRSTREVRPRRAARTWIWVVDGSASKRSLR
jgi:hypothetical protein